MKCFKLMVLLFVVLVTCRWESGFASEAIDRETEKVGFNAPKEFKDDVRFVVVVAHGVRCPVMRQNYPTFLKIMKEFEKKGVEFYFVNGVPQDSIADIEIERDRYGVPQIYRDEKQTILRDVNLKTVGETVLLERSDSRWIVRYRGGVSDRVNFDRALAKARHNYLRDAILDRLQGKAVKVPRGLVFGCSISSSKAD